MATLVGRCGGELNIAIDRSFVTLPRVGKKEEEEMLSFSLCLSLGQALS